MPKFKIEAQHVIYVTYEVEGDGHADAINCLTSEGQTLHLYDARTGKVLGFDIQHDPERVKVLHDSICWDECPEPSGAPVIRRNWTVYVVGESAEAEEEYERTNDAMNALSDNMNPVGGNHG